MEQNEKITLQKMKKEMEEMRAAYEARLQEKEEKKGTPTPRSSACEKQEAWLNEYVEIRLFKDNEKYKDDVYVAINGKNCVIKRGVWTRIRRKFAMLLDQSEIQDLRTAELIAGESLRFESDSRLRGL
ncbi:MAG: hypothetical protein IJW22_07865 [Clostridia bacterium]|nr:hypothetical protein [Clostridia bacterium]